MTNQPPFVTTTEAAEILHVHPETVRKLCVEGEIQAQWGGHAWAVSRDDVWRYRRQDLTERYRAGEFEPKPRKKRPQRKGPKMSEAERREHFRKVAAVARNKVHVCPECDMEIKGSGAYASHRNKHKRERLEAAERRRQRVRQEHAALQVEPVGWLIETRYGWQLQENGRTSRLCVVEDAVLREVQHVD